MSAALIDTNCIVGWRRRSGSLFDKKKPRVSGKGKSLVSRVPTDQGNQGIQGKF